MQNSLALAFATFIARIMSQIFHGIWITTGALLALEFFKSVFHWRICG